MLRVSFSYKQDKRIVYPYAFKLYKDIWYLCALDKETPKTFFIKHIDDIKIDTSGTASAEIQITKKIGLKLKFPNIELVQKYATERENIKSETLKMLCENSKYCFEFDGHLRLHHESEWYCEGRIVLKVILVLQISKILWNLG